MKKEKEITAENVDSTGSVHLNTVTDSTEAKEQELYTTIVHGEPVANIIQEKIDIFESNGLKCGTIIISADQYVSALQEIFNGKKVITTEKSSVCEVF